MDDPNKGRIEPVWFSDERLQRESLEYRPGVNGGPKSTLVRIARVAGKAAKKVIFG